MIYRMFVDKLHRYTYIFYYMEITIFYTVLLSLCIYIFEFENKRNICFVSGVDNYYLFAKLGFGY